MAALHEEVDRDFHMTHCARHDATWVLLATTNNSAGRRRYTTLKSGPRRLFVPNSAFVTREFMVIDGAQPPDPPQPGGLMRCQRVCFCSRASWPEAVLSSLRLPLQRVAACRSQTGARVCTPASVAWGSVWLCSMGRDVGAWRRRPRNGQARPDRGACRGPAAAACAVLRRARLAAAAPARLPAACLVLAPTQ